MKGRRLVWAALALTALSSLGFLLLRHNQPAPIPRASLALPDVAKRESSTAGTPLRVPGPAHAELPQASPTATLNAAKPDPFGPPRYAPRPAEEWQGMLINLNITPPCSSSAGCGLARACLANKCMPCERDEHCANGEACVLQHCIATELVECRHTAAGLTASAFSVGIRESREAMKALAPTATANLVGPRWYHLILCQSGRGHCLLSRRSG
jgi:hypothetical protein